MSSDVIGSAICDSQLLGLGRWDEESRRALSDWIRSGDFEERRLRASRVIPFLIERLLGDKISDEGRVRAKRLTENLVHLEDLLITARSGIGKKFYRDHLNHMLRVALFANAVASKQKIFAESQSHLDQLVLACLFHDIAYPLAESRVIIGEAVEAMESCYKAIVFPHLSYTYSMSRVTNLVNELSLPNGFRIRDLANHLDRFGHSVVGGMEFLDYVRDPESFHALLEGIVFHDSQFVTEVKFERNPLLTILIIADEFQDWGRPVAFQEEALIPEIGNMEISGEVVSGELDYRRESPLSPFRQVRSKLRNLRRLNLGVSRLTVKLRMILPRYDAVDLAGLERCIMRLWDPKCLDSLELPSDIGQEWFMERYYGTKISQATHSAVKKGILEARLIESSPLTQFDAYINSARAELILVDKSIGYPKAVALKAANGGPFHVVVEGQQEAPVKLYGEGDPRWREIAEFLVEELRIFNRLSAIHRLREEDATYLPPLGDFFLPPSSIRERLTRAGFESNELTFVDVLRDIRRSISEGGLFIIDR